MISRARYVESLHLVRLRIPTGRMVDVSPAIRSPLFALTVDTRQFGNSTFLHSLKHATAANYHHGHRPDFITIVVTDFPNPAALDDYIPVSYLYEDVYQLRFLLVYWRIRN